MVDFTPTAEQDALIAELVKHYVAHRAQYRRFLKALHSQISDAIDPDNGDPLAKLVHSVKFRLKDPEHLRDKLVRKLKKCREEGTSFPYTKESLFSEVNDLAGYRILHLHTRQMGEIHKHLVPLLEQAHKVNPPEAKTWDDETREYYESIGISTKPNPRMYSSVHYDIQPNSKVPLTIEIQVRTLADEIWGEIDHKINYPHPHESIACREQIRALARVTSSCSRLVDSIVTTHEDWEASVLAIDDAVELARAHLPVEARSREEETRPSAAAERKSHDASPEPRTAATPPDPKTPPIPRRRARRREKGSA